MEKNTAFSDIAFAKNAEMFSRRKLSLFAFVTRNVLMVEVVSVSVFHFLFQVTAGGFPAALHGSLSVTVIIHMVLAATVFQSVQYANEPLTSSSFYAVRFLTSH